MKKKTLILGKGYIGRKLQKGLNCAISGARIRRFSDVEKLIKQRRPKILINCIGHTGKRNVDDCELKLDQTLSANTFIPILLAEAALRHNIKFVHVSSGCIYHFRYGKQNPIQESRTPDYFNLYYSRTKIYAEDVLSHLSQKYNVLIPRIRVPLDNTPSPRNILDKLIRYKTIIDVPNSVTYIPDFIKALRHLLKKNARGIYNVCLKGPFYYRDLLDAYKKYRPEFAYELIKLKDLNLERTNLILSTRKLQKSGFNVRKPKEIFDECLKEYVKS